MEWQTDWKTLKVLRTLLKVALTAAARGSWSVAPMWYGTGLKV